MQGVARFPVKADIDLLAVFLALHFAIHLAQFLGAFQIHKLLAHLREREQVGVLGKIGDSRDDGPLLFVGVRDGEYLRTGFLDGLPVLFIDFRAVGFLDVSAVFFKLQHTIVHIPVGVNRIREQLSFHVEQCAGLYEPD